MKKIELNKKIESKGKEKRYKKERRREETSTRKRRKRGKDLGEKRECSGCL